MTIISSTILSSPNALILFRPFGLPSVTMLFYAFSLMRILNLMSMLNVSFGICSLYIFGQVSFLTICPIRLLNINAGLPDIK